MNKYLFLQGTMYAAQRDGLNNPSGFVSLGNAPRVVLTLGNVAAQYATAGQPAASSVDYQHMSASNSGAPPSLEIELESVTKENLIVGLYGDAVAQGAAAVTDEVCTARRGKNVALANINLTALTAIKGITGVPTYVKDIDYLFDLKFGTFHVLPGGAIADGQALKVSYTTAGYARINAFTTATAPLWLRFEGINGVDESPVVVDIFKARFAPVDSLMLIGDNLTSLALRARVLPDYYNPAEPTASRMVRIRQV